MATLKVTGLCGSLRRESYNLKLMNEAVRLFGDCSFTQPDIRFAVFDEDIEKDTGIPPEVQAAADAIAQADAVIIASPEYNQSISGVLKNALDWISRTEGSPWLRKPVAIMSANAGRAGGARGQYALRLCMTPFRPLMVPGPEVMVAGPAKEFDEHGRLQNDHYEKSLADLMTELRRAAEA
ncbi:NADPH-dependent FMN reductase [Meridianimarinicoccus aquatilis]|uniref:NAD(P)H-dependent oxidoreductase n=1 Tax=Meridianimarinicoccus aquatilis TaxID=2552766 RepID=A0A4R6AKG4_9RHOB|nr:NAD(P)H-dependent oxidoreductase [Fluviibacterium aquatile]QIE41191.1 NAD(P)H-dependent oxidoreductase [Rhodobacteraceae bacterium SC52]TDL83792.1 NAD(P)H-dependent oxidoreductase [Fluviibacterium aquatile]